MSDTKCFTYVAKTRKIITQPQTIPMLRMLLFNTLLGDLRIVLAGRHDAVSLQGRIMPTSTLEIIWIIQIIQATEEA